MPALSLRKWVVWGGQMQLWHCSESLWGPFNDSYVKPHRSCEFPWNSLSSEEVLSSSHWRLCEFSQTSEMFSSVKALSHAWSSEMHYASALAVVQACTETLRVSVAVPCSSAQQSWCFQDVFAGSAVIHSQNIIFTVCAQSKCLAHAYMLLPGKSLLDIDVWKGKSK